MIRKLSMIEHCYNDFKGFENWGKLAIYCLDSFACTEKEGDNMTICGWVGRSQV